MAARTRTQVAAIDAALQTRGDGFITALGQKHAAPFVEDGVAQLVESGAVLAGRGVTSDHDLLWAPFTWG